MAVALTLNAGSSSIKFAAFDIGADVGLSLIAKGQVAQADQGFKLKVTDARGVVIGDESPDSAHSANGGFDHDAAATKLFEWMARHEGGLDVAVVGHRVVHGGMQFTQPVRVDDEVLRQLQALVPLAPLHQPFNLTAIRLARARWPAVPQVACFDTAFHSGRDPLDQAVALPARFTDAGVKRYGFHGLSYEYIASRLPSVLATQGSGKVIVAHLGNGASLCAMNDGRSVATTMGFSVLDGLVMGSRCGALDPGVVLYLLQTLKMSADEVSDLLYKASGLLGVSGIDNDMKALLASQDPKAARAIDLFVYRIVTSIGALAAALGGVDALVFTGGIGEHAPRIRERVVAGCAWLGAALDAAANERPGGRIDARASKLRVLVVPTDEERMIALHALTLSG